MVQLFQPSDIRVTPGGVIGVVLRRWIRAGFMSAFLLFCVSGHSQAQEFRVLHTLDVRWDQEGDHFTPIASDDDGNLYFAFVNGRNKVVVGKKPMLGSVQTVEITPLMSSADRYHSTPSIALDRNGYIHIFGPMHNSDMDYWRSILPYDVSAGFARRDAKSDGLWIGVAQAGHHWITYPYVFYDNDSNPWVAFRSRVASVGWSPGTQCGQLARYDSARGRWEAIGGNANPEYSGIPGSPDPKPKCFVWSAYSQDGSNGYQAWNVKPSFDKSNRLHYPIRHVRDTGSTSWGQDLLYMYSDDSGQNWSTADGKRIRSDPVTISNIGLKNSSLWAGGPTGKSDIYGAHAGSSEGRPVVGYQQKQQEGESSTTKFAIYQGGEWNHHDTGLRAFPGRLLIDTNNVWLLLAGWAIHVSRDDGKTWVTNEHGFPAVGQHANYDVRHFKRTNKIRFVATTSSDSGTKIARIIEFVHEGWAPPESPCVQP